MKNEKPAGLRSLKGNEKLGPVSAEGSCPQRPSKLVFLGAVLNFVGNFGRALNAIEKFIAWLKDNDFL